ncbi:uncharacterized protein LOC106345379 isoform X2 [Brassica napus]|uniref:uncharacterized protein LOC106345379 isoform X2 n=1 Tax=Brassica napus TaxID=3708 RepID=UPI0020785B61|nr:uncharacterized protein LOC106345379 isoform X2 [Brassica napus]
MSDMTSLAASPSRSSKRAMYYVQSPSRDSYTSVTQPSTMMDSPTHDSYSFGRHSRNSSESRFSGISRSSSSDRKNVKKCRSNEKEYETILEEGSYEEMDDVTSIRRSQAILAVFIFISLFAFCCLITWGASRPYKPQISVQTFELRNFYVGQGSDFYGMHTKLLTLNGTLRIVEGTLSTEEESIYGSSGYRRKKDPIIRCRSKPRGHRERRKDSGESEI